MKTHRIEVIKPITEYKTANQIFFGCNKKARGPIITEIDLEFAKMNLRSANVQKNIRKNIFYKILTAISCPIKALDRFT